MINFKFQKSAADRYNALKTKREPYLERARAVAKLTIPSVMPDEGADGNTQVDLYQSLGATLATNLASKFVMSLLPPNHPFFQMVV